MADNGRSSSYISDVSTMLCQWYIHLLTATTDLHSYLEVMCELPLFATLPEDLQEALLDSPEPEAPLVHKLEYIEGIIRVTPVIQRRDIIDITLHCFFHQHLPDMETMAGIWGDPEICAHLQSKVGEHEWGSREDTSAMVTYLVYTYCCTPHAPFFTGVGNLREAWADCQERATPFIQEQFPDSIPPDLENPDLQEILRFTLTTIATLGSSL